MDLRRRCCCLLSLMVAMVLVCSLSALPGALGAQTDTDAPHATLWGWADAVWLHVLDRGGAAEGRLSDLGILQRFHRTTDHEFLLDLISNKFRWSEEYEWQHRSNGVRYWGGSINKRDLVAGAEFKARVPLSERWSFGARYVKQDSPMARRSVMRISFEHRWQGGLGLSAEGTLDGEKARSDLEFGVGWRDPKTGQSSAKLLVGLIDAFNDVIYQGLGVWSGYADTALDFESRPVTLRTAVEVPIGPILRFELHGAILSPYTFRAYEQRSPDSGFRQEEQFAYLGSLLEWRILSSVSAGLFGTYVRAVIDRTPLASGNTDDFTLTESEGQIGVNAQARMGQRWEVEAFLARLWRAEERVPGSPRVTAVDYADHDWGGQMLVAIAPWRGLRTTAAIEFSCRVVDRGDGQLPIHGSLGWDDVRANWNVGWQFSNAVFLLGIGYDLDGDREQHAFNRFDGIRGRFAFTW
ncbi:hypothetical protein ACFL3B_06545 [Gemmatimonadota bacterium]